MNAPEHCHELIQKYLESLATPAEVAELEALLTTDPAAADAFVEAASLHASLQGHFRHQYKLDQVASLLNAAEPGPVPATGNGHAAGEPGGPPQAGWPPALQMPTRLAFVRPLLDRPPRARRRFPAGQRHWGWAAVAVLLVLGGALWTLRTAGDERPRLISGQVVVIGREAAGREVADIPEELLLEVSGHAPAVIRLSGGVEVELSPATRAILRRHDGQLMVELVSGGGNFAVPVEPPGRRPSGLRVLTPLGTMTTQGGRFSLDLMTAADELRAASTPVRRPALSVVVVEGSITIEHAGGTTTLSAGEKRVFFNQT